MSSRGIHKKLARARTVCRGAGFILTKLEQQFSEQFSDGMRQQVRKAIHECHQQASALDASSATDAVQAERMHERRARNIAANQGATP